MIFASFCRINSVRVVYDRKEVKTVKKKTWKRMMAVGLTAGMLLAGSVQPVFAESDNLMDAILSEETDDVELTDEETMEDFSELTAKCHERGINICLDFVMNHTSEEHEWAKRARAADRLAEKSRF